MVNSLRDLVFRRAENRCEYCQLDQADSLLHHELEHIIARQHHGPTEESNLCVACFLCNKYKGPNLAGIDIETGELARLFHPRNNRWDDHFEWNQSRLQGRTIVGRVTVDVLKINLPQRVMLRQRLA